MEQQMIWDSLYKSIKDLEEKGAIDIGQCIILRHDIEEYIQEDKNGELFFEMKADNGDIIKYPLIGIENE